MPLTDGEAPATRSQTNAAGVERATRRKFLRSAAGGVAVAGGAALTSGFATGNAAAQKAGLSGTWVVLFNRSNPPPGFRPVLFLLTFTGGGDAVGAGPSIPFENGVAGYLNAQNGQWQQTGPSAYTMGISTTSVAADGSFNYYTNTRIDMTMAADGSSWAGTYTRHDVAADGTELRAAPGTLSATPLAPPA